MTQEVGGFDWAHGLSALIGAIFGVGSTIGTLVYRAGGREPTLRADFHKTVVEAEKRLEEKVDAAEARAEEKMTSAAHQFAETLRGLRQKINDVEHGAIAKEDFHRFRQEDLQAAERRRQENREDFARLERKIDEILGRKQ